MKDFMTGVEIKDFTKKLENFLVELLKLSPTTFKPPPRLFKTLAVLQSDDTLNDIHCKVCPT